MVHFLKKISVSGRTERRRHPEIHNCHELREQMQTGLMKPLAEFECGLCVKCHMTVYLVGAMGRCRLLFSF